MCDLEITRDANPPLLHSGLNLGITCAHAQIRNQAPSWQQETCFLHRQGSAALFSLLGQSQKRFPPVHSDITSAGGIEECTRASPTHTVQPHSQALKQSSRVVAFSSQCFAIKISLFFHCAVPDAK